MDLREERFDCIVIGAGIAGITAAKKLVAAGLSVCILEKSLGIGGRLATRRIEGESFDHGAQFFTAREAGFEKEIQNWIEKGIARPWFGEPGRERFCGAVSVNQMAKALADGLDVRREQKVERIEFKKGVWSVRTDLETFEGSRLLLTNPAPQVLGLLEASDVATGDEFIDTLRVIQYEKCISLMLLLDSELGLSESGLLQLEPGEPIATITETSVKGTTSLPGVVIQSGPGFAEDHFGSSPDTIFKQLTDALPGSEKLNVKGMSVQKWRFAKRKDHDLDRSFLRDASGFLWHAGDGYVAPRIEGAYLSGQRAAESIIEVFGARIANDSQDCGTKLGCGA